MLRFKSLLIPLLSVIFLTKCIHGMFFQIDPKLKISLEEKFRTPVHNTKELNKSVTFSFIQQRVDNFNPQDTRTWDNLFYENNDYFEACGPVYIFAGDNYLANPGWMSFGFVYDMAKETNGSIFVLEHRYYGASRPTEDMSLENMQYLMHDQVLVDLATFISFIKQDSDYENSPIILVATNYGGTIISWFHKRFPHLVDGVWASSAKVEVRSDLYSYFVAVAEDILLLGGQNCHDRIEGGFAEIQEIIDDEDNDGSELTEMFNLCDPVDMDDELSLAAFVGYLAITIGSYVEYAGELGIREICNHIDDPTVERDIDALSNFIQYVYDPLYMCLNASIDYSIEVIQDEDWESLGGMAGARQWSYQICTEFGWFRTSNEDNHPFGRVFPVRLFYDFCGTLFGESFTGEFLNANIARVNNNNGGRNPRVSNVIYTTGGLDPWRVISIVEDNIEGSDVYVIPGEVGSSDIWPISDNDSEELREVKLAIRSTILDWISSDQN